ncbi:MAG: thiamine pyrophosphate-binding protein [Gemmataceae bacterium]
MAQTAADALVEGLMRWGVDVVFGLPGDGINGIMEALRTRRDQVRFVQVRHEEAAAFMACGYAKYTGRLGCCLATSGPGGLHLLNGLYDARADQAPVIAITGQTFSDLKGSSFQQEVNLTAVFADVAGVNQEVLNPNQVPMLVDAACRHALLHRGVAHLCFPIDYQTKPLDGQLSMHKRHGHTSAAWSPAVTMPPDAEVRKAAEVLNAGRKPVLLVGKGALGASAEVAELADKLGAPVVKALLGKAVLPDDHPLTTGGLGLLGTRPSEEAMAGCDTLLIVGSSFPYIEYLPKPGQARGVQIDDRADRLALRYPVEVGLVGDARATLAALLPLVERQADRSWLEQGQAAMRDWNEYLRTHSERDDVPIKPQRLARELSEAAADDAVLSVDSGTNTCWAARLRHPRPAAVRLLRADGEHGVRCPTRSPPSWPIRTGSRSPSPATAALPC